MSDLNAQNRTYHEAQDHMGLLPNYYRWTYGALRPYLRGTVMELGCGAGHGVPHYIDLVDRVLMVDHDRTLLNSLSTRHPSSKLHTIQANLLEDWSALRQTGGVDAVVLMDVLEHFKDDTTFFEKASSLLKSGGLLVVKVPAQRQMYCRIDIASGHYRRYDEDDLLRLGERCHLEPVVLRHMNPVGSWFYQLKRDRETNFSRTFQPWQLKIINLGLPALSLLDALPFVKGLSIFAVLRKTGPATVDGAGEFRSEIDPD